MNTLTRFLSFLASIVALAAILVNLPEKAKTPEYVSSSLKVKEQSSTMERASTQGSAALQPNSSIQGNAVDTRTACERGSGTALSALQGGACANQEAVQNSL